MTWIQTCEEKIHELELIASWASITNLNMVRDYCRLAQSKIKAEIDYRKALETNTKRETNDQSNS